ncbi:hypothetical protein ARMSODRAFT_1022719 [Armillaria solidipes]|uniref:Ribonuclease H1 N-terminal domain-containing protein n=1 Tax=Armillaria solidipes TaxID=1076256 RepID=A0A2H3BKC9_9AGAR|nr:hypothetical protein ARMSODRAFT_1022719 [Armillaria solidipes]
MPNLHVTRPDSRRLSDGSMEMILLSDSGSDSSDLEIWLSAEGDSDEETQPLRLSTQNSNDEADSVVSEAPSDLPPMYEAAFDLPPVYEAMAALDIRDDLAGPTNYGRDETLYNVQSATFTGSTPDWSHAAQLTQGQSNAYVQTITPRIRRPIVQGHSKMYIVFFGREPGVYSSWSACRSRVRGASEAIFSSYRGQNTANAAFEYALERGWTGITGRYGISFNRRQLLVAPERIDFLQAPESAFDTALNAGHDRPRCYLVVLQPDYIPV